MESNITFTKVNGHYEGLVTVSSPSAIHIVREKDGLFAIKQTHKNDDYYAEVESVNPNNRGAIIDFVVTDEVYPVYLQLISSSSVTSAKLITG